MKLKPALRTAIIQMLAIQQDGPSGANLDALGDDALLVRAKETIPALKDFNFELFDQNFAAFEPRSSAPYSRGSSDAAMIARR